MNRLEIVPLHNKKKQSFVSTPFTILKLELVSTDNDISTYNVIAITSKGNQKQALKTSDDFIFLFNDLNREIPNVYDSDDSTGIPSKMIELIGHARRSQSLQDYSKLLDAICASVTFMPTVINWLFPGEPLDDIADVVAVDEDAPGQTPTEKTLGTDDILYEVLYDWEPEVPLILASLID